MKGEAVLLNFICIIAAVGLIALAVVNALSSGDFLTTDNLFLITVCLVLALMFAINPLLYLRSRGKLPIPFLRSASSDSKPSGNAGAATSSSWGATALPKAAPALLDAKGRPVPPDVRAIVERIKQPRQEQS